MTRARCVPTAAGDDRTQERTQDLAGALHEVSNALTVVLGWLDVARSKLPNGPERDALEVARTHARIGYGIARQAIGAEVADSTSGQASARATATTAITGVTPEGTRRGVELVIDSFTSGHEQIASVGPALQILTNLLLNAIAFTPRGRKVTLTVRDDGSSAIFTVQDEGPGIPPERVDTLFEGPVSTRRGGAGVGLRHSHALAESHGGSLSLIDPNTIALRALSASAAAGSVNSSNSVGFTNSTSSSSAPASNAIPTSGIVAAPIAPAPIVPACGACFELRWPLAEARSSTRPQQPLVASVRGARVLVLEDDAAVRSLIELALEARGAETVLVSNARDFERALLIGGFDTALIDLSPIAGGPHAAGGASPILARLRSANPGIAVILISGVASGVPEEIESQVSAWVRKPFEMGEVLEVMSRLLEARRARCQLDSAAG
ncbi:MAG: ATP-binding protein [Myxococcota bacterium]